MSWFHKSPLFIVPLTHHLVRMFSNRQPYLSIYDFLLAFSHSFMFLFNRSIPNWFLLEKGHNERRFLDARKEYLCYAETGLVLGCWIWVHQRWCGDMYLFCPFSEEKKQHLGQKTTLVIIGKEFKEIEVHHWATIENSERLCYS